MKIIIKIVVVLIILIAVLMVGGVVMIDSIARKGIETASTTALGVPTTLARADVGILNGTFSMGGLNVANPEGFDSPTFLALGDGSVAVSLGTLRKDTIELPTLALDDVKMTLLRKGGKANYDVILGNLKRFESQGGDKSAGGKTDEGKRFIVHELTIRNVNVHVDMIPEGGKLTQVDIPVDEIRLTEVGSNTSKGVLLSELSGVILKTIITVVVNKGGELLPDDMLNDLSGQLGDLQGLAEQGVSVFVGDEGIVNAAKDLGENVGKQLDKTGKEVGEKVDETLKGIGDILGGDKKKKDDN